MARCYHRYGGDCSSGGANIVAQPGFWGVALPPAVVFKKCPLGYCCTTAPCASFDGCADGSHRHGTLCGACKPGYSAALGSSVCVANSSCRGAGLAFTVVGVCICSFLYALYCLVSSDSFASEVDVTIYWLQMASILLGTSGTLTLVESTVLRMTAHFVSSVTQLKLDSTSDRGGLCLYGGESSVEIAALELFFPVLIAIAIVAIHAAMAKCTRFPACTTQPDDDAYNLRPSLLLHGETEDATTPLPLGRTRRLEPALLKLAFFGLSLFVSSATSLLACVVVEGEEETHRLFIQAELVCYTSSAAYFQIPIFITVVLLSVVLALTACCDLFPVQHTTCRYCAHSVWAHQLRSITSEPFGKGTANWGSVMALHRIALAALSATPWNATTQMLGMALVCAANYHLHLAVQPFIDARMNRLQGELLLALLILAVLQIPACCYSTNANQPADEQADILHQIAVSCAYASLCILALPLAWGAFFVMIPWATRWCVAKVTGTTVARDSAALASERGEEDAGSAIGSTSLF